MAALSEESERQKKLIEEKLSEMSAKSDGDLKEKEMALIESFNLEKSSLIAKSEALQRDLEATGQQISELKAALETQRENERRSLNESELKFSTEKLELTNKIQSLLGDLEAGKSRIEKLSNERDGLAQELDKIKSDSSTSETIERVSLDADLHLEQS